MGDKWARVSRLPYRNGDGYSWGGEVILTIGDTSILLGAEGLDLARDMAKAWNTYVSSQKEGSDG